MADGKPYEPPPTKRDLAQSVVHHGDSAVYNLRHAKAHLDEALGHVEAQQDRLSRKPTFRPHTRAVEGTMTNGDAGDDDENDRLERTEPRTGDVDRDQERGESATHRARVLGDDGRGTPIRPGRLPFGRSVNQRQPRRGVRR